MRVKTVMLYLKIGGRFALFLDADRGYGFKPVLKFRNFGSETIIDVPFIRCIITPGGRLHEEYKRNAGRDDRLSEGREGTAKDRS